jgi:hypothetical protein
MDILSAIMQVQSTADYSLWLKEERISVEKSLRYG